MWGCKVLKRFCIYLLGLALIAVTAGEVLAADSEKPTSQPSLERAVSLRVLEERARTCMAKGECPELITLLCGIRSITGFVIDYRNKDVILHGLTNQSLPPLHLDDLVVAIRSVWMKYAQLKGNTYYYSAPGCSIDPDPKTVAKLFKIAEKDLSAREDMNKVLEAWNKICGEPQQVRVLGVPFQSHFAAVTVQADYDMKRLVNGSVSLNIEGFQSLTDMTLNEARKAMEANQRISMPLSCLDRFWFVAGDNLYEERDDAVRIVKSEVKLMTEEEFLTKTGDVVGTGKASPLALEFSRNFTMKYKDISKQKLIYAELEALYRFVAVAKIIKFKDGLSRSGLQLDYFMNRYPVRTISVPRTLPGLSHVKGLTHRRDVPGGYEVAEIHLPTCGGVEVDIRVDHKNFRKDNTGRLQKLRKAILASRPSAGALHWDYPNMEGVR